MIVNYFTQIMAPGFVLGLVVLCYCLPSVFAEQECPSSFDCERFGLMSFPFTNNTNTECGLYLSGCDHPGSTVEVRLGYDENKKATWLQIESISLGTSILSSTMVVQHTALLKLISYLDERHGDCPTEGWYPITLPPASPIMSLNKEIDGTMNLMCAVISLMMNIILTTRSVKIFIYSMVTPSPHLPMLVLLTRFQLSYQILVNSDNLKLPLK